MRKYGVSLFLDSSSGFQLWGIVGENIIWTAFRRERESCGSPFWPHQQSVPDLCVLSLWID